jgi:hypothetical protein
MTILTNRVVAIFGFVAALLCARIDRGVFGVHVTGFLGAFGEVIAGKETHPASE